MTSYIISKTRGSRCKTRAHIAERIDTGPPRVQTPIYLLNVGGNPGFMRPAMWAHFQRFGVFYSDEYVLR
jgi:hypothetical protein